MLQEAVSGVTLRVMPEMPDSSRRSTICLWIVVLNLMPFCPIVGNRQVQSTIIKLLNTKGNIIRIIFLIVQNIFTILRCGGVSGSRQQSKTFYGCIWRFFVVAGKHNLLNEPLLNHFTNPTLEKPTVRFVWVRKSLSTMSLVPTSRWYWRTSLLRWLTCCLRRVFDFSRLSKV